MPTGKRILLVQLYSNGDCLYATAIARQIKSDFPGCHLTWAIAGFCQQIIAHNPYTDAVMVVNTVPKDNIPALRVFKKQVYEQQAQGLWDEVFITMVADTNIALYDGSIRSSIYRAYPHPVTVPVTPVLVLTAAELAKAAAFAAAHRLTAYTHVVLFEYAPMSNQSNITTDFAITVAEGIVANNNTAIILSSANAINHPNAAIIDGSSLTLRETAALTHYCSFLLGSSSGITWISTSTAGKPLPMVQMLNAYANFANPISVDFERFKISKKGLIELFKFDASTVVACVQSALNDFSIAKSTYNQTIPLHFNTTRKIVYNLLCYLEFRAIGKHIKVYRQLYGNRLEFYMQVILGFITFPFKLIRNVIVKKKWAKK